MQPCDGLTSTLMDIVNPETRSRMMSSIRGQDTKPEVLVRRFLHSKGFRFRLHRHDIPGRPDLILPRWRAAVLVHGCFWHGHSGCRYFRLPRTRPEFWSEKFAANVARDARTENALMALCWRVFVVWECAMRDHREEALEALVREIPGQCTRVEISSPLGQLELSTE